MSRAIYGIGPLYTCAYENYEGGVWGGVDSYGRSQSRILLASMVRPAKRVSLSSLQFSEIDNNSLHKLKSSYLPKLGTRLDKEFVPIDCCKHPSFIKIGGLMHVQLLVLT